MENKKIEHIRLNNIKHNMYDNNYVFLILLFIVNQNSVEWNNSPLKFFDGKNSTYISNDA